MKFLDRLRLVYRAIVIALNPNVEAVLIKTVNPEGEVDKNFIIAEDSEISVGSFYYNDLIQFYVNHSESKEECIVNVNMTVARIENAWNEANPDNQLLLKPFRHEP